MQNKNIEEKEEERIEQVVKKVTGKRLKRGEMSKKQLKVSTRKKSKNATQPRRSLTYAAHVVNPPFDRALIIHKFSVHKFVYTFLHTHLSRSANEVKGVECRELDKKCTHFKNLKQQEQKCSVLQLSLFTTTDRIVISRQQTS